ncbi:MAG: hypothetical protein U0T78_03925 [Cloacibacterium normanense]
MYYLLSGLLMVLYAADEEVYTNIKDSISDVLEIQMNLIFLKQMKLVE